MAKYHVLKHDTEKTVSDLTVSDLKEMARAGQLAPNDRVRKSGHTTWHRASVVRGLDFCEPSTTPATPESHTGQRPADSKSVDDEVDRLDDEIAKLDDEVDRLEHEIRNSRAPLWAGIIGIAVVVLAFYVAGWSFGDRRAYSDQIFGELIDAAAKAVEEAADDSEEAREIAQKIVLGGMTPEALYRTTNELPFFEQVALYQIGITADNGRKWYGLYATNRFLDLGWWTFIPFGIAFGLLLRHPIGFFYSD